MKIKTLIIIGFSVVLSGCLGIDADEKHSLGVQPISDNNDRPITNLDIYKSKKQLHEHRIARMIDWVEISKN